MDVIELRADLHNMIDKITDSNILNAVKILLSSKSLSKDDWWDKISDEERKEIPQGMKDVEEGNVTPHEEVMAKYKKWK